MTDRVWVAPGTAHQGIPAWEMKHVKNHVALPRVEVPSYNREAASVARR